MTKPPQATAAYRKANIKEMMDWSLDKKINHSLKRIREFYVAQDGKIYVAFSGGKDSTVLLHLVRSLFPDAVAVFSNTTNEFLEILEFVKQTENVVTVHPKMTFNQTVREYGFPLVGKTVAKSIRVLRENKPTTANVRNLYLTGMTRAGNYSAKYHLAKKWRYLYDREKTKFEITEKCCDILKKEPLIRFQKESGLFPIIGTQASESTSRKTNWIEHGCNILDNKEPKSRPLSLWTTADIWEYIERFNVPYSTIYDDIIDEETGEVLVGGGNIYRVCILWFRCRSRTKRPYPHEPLPKTKAKKTKTIQKNDAVRKQRCFV